MPSHFCLISLLALASLASAGQNAFVSGLVRDKDGKGVAGALVTARTADGAERGSARTGMDGAYRIDALPSGEYSVTVNTAGYAAIRVTVSPDAPAASADFVLPSPLKFAASGVRGSIDPGGYSAPAQAAARSGLLAEMSQMHQVAAKQSSDAAKPLEACGKFREASEAYRSAAERDPSESNLLGVGYELMQAGSYGEAATAFRGAREKRPQSINIWIASGTAEFLAGHEIEALEDLLHAVELDPTNARAYKFLEQATANSETNADRVDAAFQHYAVLAPDHADALYYQALSMVRTRRKGAAAIESLLHRAVALDNGFAPAHLQLAVLYANRGDTAAAIREYERTVQLAPGIAEAHYRLALLYRQMGRTESAETEMRTFQTLHDAPHTAIGVEEFGAPVLTACPDSLH